MGKPERREGKERKGKERKKEGMGKGARYYYLFVVRDTKSNIPMPSTSFAYLNQISPHEKQTTRMEN